MAHFFELAEIEASEVESHSDVFDQIRRRELQGVLVHNLYPSEILSEVVARLERHDPPFVQTWFPEKFRSCFYGMNLNLTNPEQLPGYFAETEKFHRQLGELFPSPWGVFEYLAPFLSKLDRGKPFVAPPGPRAGQSYMFTTIRAHDQGGFIPPHCDNEQAYRPSFAQLHTQIRPPMMSFVLALSCPTGGGFLEVYDYQMNAVSSDSVQPARSRQAPDFSTIPSVKLQLQPGSLIVLDSGRYLHRVSKIEGTRKRWTLCSFLAENRAGDQVFCWG
tara:strand:+ start:3372 stop:4196 length:825 start_codon:yes stop_codon:yes gene_type:complete